MAKAINLTICHLYPDLMDTYGDRGNIITLQQRCSWRGITTDIVKLSTGDIVPGNVDIFFFGGGQDQAQALLSNDLKSKSSAIEKHVQGGGVLLAICGGYQLLQRSFKTKSGQVIEGLGVFDAFTEASNERMIQNLLIETSDGLKNQIEKVYPSKNLPSGFLVGFENHSGKTFLGKNCKPLGAVIAGSGNNGDDSTEGAIYKNAFGCYLHGSLLPKNPHFADFLIYQALINKGFEKDLQPLDDTFEWNAHYQAVERTRSSS